MERIAKEIEKWDIFECHLPRQRTIAGSVIYFFTNLSGSVSNLQDHKRSLTEIKEAAGISTDHTIKKYYNMLWDKKDMLISRALKPGDSRNAETDEDNSEEFS